MRISDWSSDVCSSDLAQKSIDLGIGLLSNIDRQERYGHRLLVRSRRRVWASATHPLAGQTTVSLKEIAQHPYIMLTVDDADTAAARHWDGMATTLNVAMRTSSLEALRGLVAYGFGDSIDRKSTR